MDKGPHVIASKGINKHVPARNQAYGAVNPTIITEFIEHQQPRPCCFYTPVQKWEENNIGQIVTFKILIIGFL